MSKISASIGFLGAGQMATALASGFVSSGLISGKQVIAADPFPAARDAFSAKVKDSLTVEENEKVVAKSDIVFLAVKPQYLQQLADSLPAISKDKLIVSIVAGVQTAQLQQWFGTDRIIRVMPNTPCLIGECAAGFCAAAGASEADIQQVQQLLEAVGIAYQVEERLLDSVTGLSGSGPAYIYILIEALSDAGVRVGLPRDVATRLAAQTVKGSAEMVLQTGEHPGSLKDKVTSPGGTTIAGLHALEENGFRNAVIDAVVAATERSIELGAS